MSNLCFAYSMATLCIYPPHGEYGVVILVYLCFAYAMATLCIMQDPEGNKIYMQMYSCELCEWMSLK